MSANPNRTANPTLAERLSTESDLCRNDGAADIAALLDEAAVALTAAESRALRAEDACEKDGLARAHASGMEMEINYLRAALTAAEARIAEAVYQEREACRAIANMVGDKKDGGHSLGYRAAGWEIAELIAARGANRA